jgi:GT2 family glycosyltransferase/Flp pilus assembly protein TadD
MHNVEVLKRMYNDKEIYTCPAIGGRINFNPSSISLCHGFNIGDQIIKHGIDDKITSDLYLKYLTYKINENQNPNAPCSKCLQLKKQVFNFQGILFLTICTSEHCNSKCVFCTSHTQNEVSSYSAIPFIRDFIDNGLINPDCLFDYGGGEPTINRYFKETFTFLSDKNYRQRVNTNSIQYSEYLAEALRNGLCSIRTSVDAGTRETYKRVKGVDKFDQVWDSLKKYRLAGTNVIVKYIIFNYNSNKADVNGFIDRCVENGIQTINIDTEYNSYATLQSNGRWPLSFDDKELYIAHYFEDQAHNRGLNVITGAAWATRDPEGKCRIPLSNPKKLISTITNKNDNLKNRNDSAGLYKDSTSLFKKGRLAEAIEMMHHAISMAPGNVDFYNDLGVMYRASGNESKAQRYFERVLEISASNPAALKNLVEIFAEKKLYERALDLCTRLKSLHPDDQKADRLMEAIQNFMKQNDAEGNCCEIEALSQESLFADDPKIWKNPRNSVYEKNKTTFCDKSSSSGNDLRLIAFYLPQYHPIPENDLWWGKGFTEWVNVAKARPLFSGHYQPHIPADLGFYDLRLQETRKAQASLAREYGIYGFCYYHYWFNGKLLLDYPLQQVLKTGEPDFPFCLCWANENWTRTWDGLNSDILIKQDYNSEDDVEHIRHLSGIFKDKRYIRINGKPLFIVYRASNLPDPLKTTSLWREEARKAGIGELFLCRVERFVEDMKDPRPLGFDAAVEFQPDGIHLGKPLKDPKYKGNFVYEYEAMVKAALLKKDPGYLRFPCVCPSWDNSARRRKQAVIFHNSNPQIYESWLKETVQREEKNNPEERLVFINAFNEWGEGCHLEPDQMHGNAYLEATARAVLSVNNDDRNSLQRISNKNSEGECRHDVCLPAASKSILKVAPRVSIIIPLFNKLEYTRQCLDALFENTPQGVYEVIIIDNESTDGTPEFLESFQTGVTIITNKTNSGFAKACNQGACASKGEYLLFLNNDTEPGKGWLEPLLLILDNDQSVVAAGSKLLFPDGDIQHAGVVIIDDRKLPDPLVARHIFYKQPSNLTEANRLRTYQALTAACVLIRKDSYERAGGFDEGYWNGYEDVDLCFKLQQNGGRLVYQPESVVVHHESKSGPERFKKVGHNIQRLHERWKGKIQPDIILNEDGSVLDTGARRIQPYALSKDVKPAIAPVAFKKQSNPVSIIIAVSSGIKRLTECIESILTYTPDLQEIVLLETSSAAGLREYLKAFADNHDNVAVILKEEINGVVEGYNQGLARSKGDYIVLLSSDVVVTEDWLKRLSFHLDKHSDAGMVGPMSNPTYGPQQIQAVPYGKDMAALQGFARKFTAENLGKAATVTRLEAFCLLIRREMINVTGGLDESLSKGFAFDDLCLRSLIADYKNLVAQDVFVHCHRNMISEDDSPADLQAAMQANRERFKEKWKDIVEFKGDDYIIHLSEEQKRSRLVEWAEERLSVNDVKGAAGFFERLFRLVNTDFQALNSLGAAQWQIGEAVSAINTFQTALVVNPADPGALANLLQAAAEAERFDLIKLNVLNALKQSQPANPDVAKLIDGQQGRKNIAAEKE